MPHLTSDPLTSDPDGMAFLQSVIGTQPGSCVSLPLTAAVRWSPPLSHRDSEVGGAAPESAGLRERETVVRDKISDLV